MKKKVPQRFLVVGCGGSGKSTFSVELAKTTGLELHHLDSLYWKAGWNHTPPKEWERTVRKLIQRRSWIIDGSYFGTLELRLSQADAVVFFDLPRWVCLWRVLKRRLLNMGRDHRLGMPQGCPERIYFSFLKWVWNYPKNSRPQVVERLMPFSKKGMLYHIKDPAETKELLRSLAGSRTP